MQESLFQDPLGVRLRLARERNGLTAEAAARALRLPVAIINAMEQEDWQRLGAPIYVRAHLSAYLELVGLPITLAEVAAASKPAPKLAAMDSRSRFQGSLERGLRNAVYLTMTAVIVVPVVWLATHYDTRQKLVEAINLEPDALPVTVSPAPAATSPARAVASSPLNESAPAQAEAESGAPIALDDASASAREVEQSAPAAAASPPVVASLAPFQAKEAGDAAPPAGPAPGGVKLSFRDQSWFELQGADGRRIERGLIEAGSERVLPAGEALRVTLGNADAVDVSVSGTPLELAPFRSANVARFTVSSTLDVAPAGH